MNSMDNKNTQHHNAILEGINTLCKIYWGPDLETCRKVSEKKIFKPFEIILSDHRFYNNAAHKTSTLDLLSQMASIPDLFETAETLYSHLDECYISLFVSNKTGIIPLYQSCYEFENAPMMGPSAQQMAERLKEKGLSLENNLNEPPDHLAIELEFLFFLLQEESKSQYEEGGRIFSKEAGLFTSDNLLPWVTEFCRRLESVSSDCRFYLLATKMLVFLLEIIGKNQI